MQVAANTTTRQFEFNRFNTTLMALGLAAGIAIGATGEALIDNMPTLRTGEQAIVRPKAHTSVNQGEGMLGGTTAVTAAVRAHTADRQGEGILGDLGSDVAARPLVKAYNSVGMGEGWQAYGRPEPTVRAYSSEGQGEGWLGNGRP